MANHAFADLFKNSWDVNQLCSTQRRNIEALSAVNQAIVKGAQDISRRQADAIHDHVETVLNASKDFLTSGSPQTGIAKQADLAKSLFESTLSNLREMTELVTKSGFQAFNMLNRRAAESLEEISNVSSSRTAKKK